TSIQFIIDFEVNPDSTTVVYMRRTFLEDFSGNVIVDQVELFASPLSGGAGLQLNHPLRDEEDVQGFAFTPDGAQVLYESTEHLTELRSVPVDGTHAPVLLGNTRSVSSLFKPTPDSTRVILSNPRLVSVQLDGGAPIPLSSPPLLGSTIGDVQEYRITPNGRRVVYRDAVQLGGSLHVVPAEGGLPPVRL